LTVKESGGCTSGIHQPTSIVHPIHHRTESSWLLSIAGDPFTDVRGTVAKGDAVAFARPEEADNVSIHKDDVLEIKHHGPPCRFRSEQRGQFADVVGSESTDYGEHDVTMRVPLDFEHRSRRARRWQVLDQR